MRRMMLAIWLMLAPLAALAADKGGPLPGTLVDDVEAPRWHGLYVEGSGAIAAVEAGLLGATVSQVGAGLGWDYRVSQQVVAGVLVRYDVALDGSEAHALTLGGRLGLLINPHLLLYVPLLYTMDGRAIDLSDGIWATGLGVETAVLGGGITLFAEGTRDVSMTGGFRVLDEAITARAGVRVRF